jgi:hypothetical protein
MNIPKKDLRTTKVRHGRIHFKDLAILFLQHFLLKLNAMLSISLLVQCFHAVEEGRPSHWPDWLSFLGF